MLRHIVMFRWKPETPPEEIATLEATLRALPEAIPQVVALEGGPDTSVEGLSHGFSHCFVVTFASAADRDAYLPHPAHAAFVARARPHLADVLVVDYLAV